MTATDNLARWRETEQAATEGPWREAPHGFGVGIEGPIEGEQLIVEMFGLTYPPNPADAAFIATSRTAVPALLAFAEAVLAYSQPPWDETIIGAAIRDLAEQHLGGDQ